MRTFRASRTASSGCEQSVHDFGIARRRLEIAKLRGVAYVGGFHDFKIETGGIRVFPRLENRRQNRPLPKETLKSGLAPLDALLDNGVPMGTCTLILGPSGVGKSTLGAHYLASAARKGIALRRVSLRRTAADLPRSRRRARDEPLEVHEERLV